MNGIALQVLGYADLPKMEGPKDPSRSGTIQMYNSFESILSSKQTDMSKTNFKSNARDSFPESTQRNMKDLKKDKMQFTNAKDLNQTRDIQGKDSIEASDNRKEKSDLSKPIEKLKKKVEVLKKAIAETTDDSLKKELQPILAAAQEVIQKLENLENNQTLALTNVSLPMELVEDQLANLKSMIESIQTDLSDVNTQLTLKTDSQSELKGHLEAFKGIIEKVESALNNMDSTETVQTNVATANETNQIVSNDEKMTDVIPKLETTQIDSQAEVVTQAPAVSNTSVKEAAPENTDVATEVQSAVGSKVATETKGVANETTATSDQVEALSTVESVTVESTQNGSNEQTTSGNQGKSTQEENVSTKKENSDHTIKSIDISKNEPTLTKMNRPEHSTPMRKLETSIMHQIQNMMKSSFKMVKDASGEMTLKLKPESLGQVSLKLVMGADGQMTADFKVENLMVKGILESNMGELKASLLEKGIQVNQFDVSLNDGGQGNKGQHANQQNHSRGNGSTANNESEFEKEVLLKQHLNDEETTINSLV